MPQSNRRPVSRSLGGAFSLLTAVTLLGACPASKTEEHHVEAPPSSVAVPLASTVASLDASSLPVGADAGTAPPVESPNDALDASTPHPAWCTANPIKHGSSCDFLKNVAQRQARAPRCEQEKQVCACGHRRCITPAGPIPNCDSTKLDWECRPKNANGCPPFLDVRTSCTKEGLTCPIDDGLCVTGYVCKGGWFQPSGQAPSCRPATPHP